MLRTAAIVAAVFLLSGVSVQGDPVPANIGAREAAANGTRFGREVLTFIGTSNATLAGTADYFAYAHAAAEETYVTAYAGQQSGTIGAAAAGGAALLASAVAILNDTSLRTAAETELSKAESLVSAIQDENPLQNSNATNANLLLLYQIGHDGTLAQYWQNITEGEAGDNSTFEDTIEFVGELAEGAQERLEAGASPALVSIAAEMVARNILSAIYVYQGNATLAYQEGLAEARLILKAVNSVQSGSSCGGANSAEYLTEVNEAVEAAQKAAASLSTADISAAQQAAQAVVDSPSRCASVAPAIAPATAAAASLGRRLF